MTAPVERLVNIAEVEAMTARERTTINRAIRAGTFPAPAGFVGPHRVWRHDDVAGWVQSQLARPRDAIGSNLNRAVQP